ncbi:MAG: hypothetical protein KIS66_08065 [Fimbriimonadaceae bacterium]|nr:hypothetical protein [Fimbriimonadaceae bacterium]
MEPSSVTEPGSPSSLPGWLLETGPDTDAVVSSRARVMRNLRGHRFPHACSPEEAREVAEAVSEAAIEAGLFPVDPSSRNESDLLLGSRLVSPDFRSDAPGRIVLADAARRVVVMVNEEDHLRVQSLTSGLSSRAALDWVTRALEDLGTRLAWAAHPAFGHLAASPYNCGEGTRVSALFHLIGLAQTGRLTSVLRACADYGIVARGQFGERSRAVGAFLQLSHTGADRTGFEAACRYLVAQEREARSIALPTLPKKLEESRAFLRNAHLLSLADALRSLGWLRWAACEGLIAASPRDTDLWTTFLQSGGDPKDRAAGRFRATFLRDRIG